MLSKNRKHCCCCKEIKALAKFHKNRAKPDGLASECKECAKERVALWQKSEKGIIKKRVNALRYCTTSKGKVTAKNWRHTETGKIYVAKRGQRMRERHGAKYRARTAVFHAIRAGKLPNIKTLRCIFCGKPAEEYHHQNGYDVNHHLDIIPLCALCHRHI